VYCEEDLLFHRFSLEFIDLQSNFVEFLRDFLATFSPTCLHRFHGISHLFHFQKPLMLQGHERSITQIKYNREGDLLFSSSKDNRPNVWFSVNGERLGTYNGHQGAVWCLDVDWTSTKFMSGGGDMTMR
jgi:WD40 repeat protein